MREYVRQQTAALLRKWAAALHQAAKDAGPDSIHDVRVATRRLSRCLRVFAPFYPDSHWKKIRRQLSALMSAAGAVRDCDIAMELVQQAGARPRAAVMTRLAAERRKNGDDLLLEIRRWKRRSVQRKWKSRLDV